MGMCINEFVGTQKTEELSDAELEKLPKATPFIQRKCTPVDDIYNRTSKESLGLECPTVALNSTGTEHIDIYL